MEAWIYLAAILAGALAFLAFWLGKKEGRIEPPTPFLKETLEAKKEIFKEELKSPKKVELHFNDGSKMVLDENSPYYQDFIDYADKILSKKEKDAKERAHSSST